jgi:hypothetical protein
VFCQPAQIKRGVCPSWSGAIDLTLDLMPCCSIINFSQKVNMEELRMYRIAVGIRNLDIISKACAG